MELRHSLCAISCKKILLTLDWVRLVGKPRGICVRSNRGPDRPRTAQLDELVMGGICEPLYFNCYEMDRGPRKEGLARVPKPVPVGVWLNIESVKLLSTWKALTCEMNRRAKTCF